MGSGKFRKGEAAGLQSLSQDERMSKREMKRVPSSWGADENSVTSFLKNPMAELILKTEYIKKKNLPRKVETRLC